MVQYQIFFKFMVVPFQTPLPNYGLKSVLFRKQKFSFVFYIIEAIKNIKRFSYSNFSGDVLDCNTSHAK